MASRPHAQAASSNRRGQERVHNRVSSIANNQKLAAPKPLRRSTRLSALHKIHKDRSRKSVATDEVQSPRPQRQSLSYEHKIQPFISTTRISGNQKRKREDENLDSRKRRRPCVQLVREDSAPDRSFTNPIDYWRRSGYRWPAEDSSKISMDVNPTFSYLLARKKSTSSLRRKRSDGELSIQSSNTLSDQKYRDAKSASYRDPRYETLLTTKGSIMRKVPPGAKESAKDSSKDMCKVLRETPQSTPRDSLFEDDVFDDVCEAIRNKNETRVIQDVARLLVPSAETLAIKGDKSLRILIESVNEGWNNSIALTATRPQPDYAVGFRREAFTDVQLEKLKPFVGELTDQSYFMATYYLYFPFLTCEVKCGAAALDVADRQNAHSMTLAVRAVVELFRLKNREMELDREVLAFSISHDHRSVRLYGHYAVIGEKETLFYRYPIHDFSFTALDGRDKWTALKFTKSVYRDWMPGHFKRLCSVIDTLSSSVNFDVSQQSKLHFSDHTSLSQDLESHGLAAHVGESASFSQDNDNLSELLEPPDTPATSFTKESARGKGKAKRSRHQGYAE